MATVERFNQRLWRRASTVLKRSLIVAGAVSVTAAIAAQAVTRARLQKALKLPDDFILVMDLEGTDLVEKADSNPLAQLRSGKKQLQLSKVTDALHRAGTDKRVCGLTSCISDNQTYAGLAPVQELRSAILDFRQLKKDAVPSVAYSDSFGEGGATGTLGYYLASAFEQIYVQQNGLISFTGLSASTPFLRGLLDKWEIVPQAFAREEYKAVVQQFTDKQYSKANREATQALLRSYIDQIVDDVAVSRGLSTEQVSLALHASPLTAQSATAAGLITGAKYREQATKTVLHNTQLSGDPLPLLAANWEHNKLLDKVAAANPAKGKSIVAQDASNKAESAPESAAESGNGEAKFQAERSGSAAAMLARVEERSANARSSKGATVITDSATNLRVAKISTVPLSKYIRALEAEKQQKDKKGFIATLLAASSSESEDETALNESSKPKIAVVTAAGPIAAGSDSPAGASRGPVINSATVCNDLQTARQDPAVKAIVFRVDSPGGSAVASDSIWREVQQVRQSGKPIIVSMGTYAASGGYYISAPATKIVAQPGTLTGSIGVAAFKPDISKPVQKQGINVECVKVGRNANATSLFSQYNKRQEAQVNDVIDRVYMDFMGKVASGRGMSLAEVHKLAKGRIWSGEDAREMGLVDSLGGLSEAIAIAKQESGLSEEEGAVDVVPFPHPKPFWKQLQERLGDQSPMGASLALTMTTTAEAMGLMSATDDVAFAPLLWAAAASKPELQAAVLLHGSQPAHGMMSTAQSYLTQMQSGGVQMMCPPIHIH